MNRKILWGVGLFLALAPIALLAVLYGALPDQVPVNWGFHGQVSYDDKSTLWMLTLLSPLLLFLFRAFPRVDPRKKNYAKFQGYYDGFCLFMLLFLLCLDCLILSESLWPGRIAVWRVIVMAVGVLFMVLGNIMPKFKNNFFAGIRTPWTLSDPDVWNRTNRLGGRCLFLLGLVMLPAGLLLGEQLTFALLMAGIAVVVLVPVVLSYVWYQKKQKGPLDKGGGQ